MRAEKYRALVLVGGPGSGKDILLRTMFKESNVLEVNLDQLYKVIQEQAKERSVSFYALKKINEGAPLVVNGSARRDGKVTLVRKVLEQMGYETEHCIVTSTNDISKSRNDARISSGTKTITEDVRRSKWNEAFEYIRLNENSAMVFDNSLETEAMRPKLETLQRWVSLFFETRTPTLDEAVSGFLDENLKREYQAHKELSLVSDKPKTGTHEYHKYNEKRTAPKKKTTPTQAPVSPEHLESSDGAYLSTEAKEPSFKKFRKQTTKPPTNTQYVGDPQGVGGATADLREDKKPTKEKSKSAKPPTITADARVGDDQAVTTTLGMVGEQTNKRVISLRKLREEVSVKSPDGEFIENEVYEDIGIDGERVMYEGRAITTNKPFKRGDNYSVYIKTENSIERLDFGNHKRVLQEIFDALAPETDL
jgi:predicted ABC-type ATPase